MKSGKNKIGSFIIMFLLLFIIVVTIASLVYIAQYRIIRNEKSNELNTLFKLKETQILDWLNERKSDARFFKNNSDMVFHFDQYLKNKGNVKFMENLKKYSTTITSTGHYKSLAFLDENYNVVYSFSGLSSGYVMQDIHPEYLDSARYSDHILNTDFHYTPDSQILFHIIVPLKNEAQEGQNFLGFLLLNIDPMNEFYPLFQTFQVYSNTAEALLVKKEGDMVIFLNELRHAKGSALKMKFPLNNQNLTAVKAIGGITGTVDAEDYRGKKVLAAIGPVTGTHWYLVVKIDKVEIFKDFRVFVRNTWIMSILLIIIGTLLLRILWLRRSAESDKNYRELINGMNETIWLIGLDGNILDVNNRAINVLGYTKEELLSMGLPGIDSSLEKEKIAELVKNMPKDTMQFFETSHKTKDGSIIPVEINSSLVTYQGKRAILSVARDITDRKKAEQELINRDLMLNRIFDLLPVGLWLTDKNGKLIRSNPAGIKIWGGEQKVPLEEFGIFKARRLPSLEELGPQDQSLHQTITQGVTITDELLEIDTFDGQKRIILNYTAPVLDSKGEILGAIIVNNDITVLKKVEEALKTNYHLLKIAGESAKFGGWSLDLVENNIQWSDVIALIHEEPAGFSPAINEAINYFVPEWRDKITDIYKLCIEQGISFDKESEIITSKGNRRWVRVIGEAVRDDKGNIIKLQGSFQDITKIKLAEIQLEESRMAMSRLISNLYGIAYRCKYDNHWTMEFISKGCKNLTGYSDDDFYMGRITWSSLIEEEDRDPVYTLVKECIQKNEYYHIEYRVKHRDGRIFWLWEKGCAVYDLNGAVIALEGYISDITERKTSEIELKKNKEFIQTIIENLPIGFAVNSVKPVVSFEYINENFYKFYEVSKEDLSSPDTFWEKVYEDAGYREEIKNRVLADIAIGDPEKMRWNDIPITRNGKLIRYISAGNIPMEEGNYMISTVWDVTERKLIEQEIIKLNAELEERVNERTRQLAAKNHELETFAYSVSHDLKAPLRGIDGYSRILLEEYSNSLNEEAQKYLNNVREGTMHMSQLIDDLLDYSKLERYNLNPVSVSLLKFVKSTIDQVFNVYSAKNIKIKNTISDIQIIVDSRGLAIALRNLIENAVKFTGTIKNPLIELSFEDKEVSYILSVRDNGIGFDMQYHSKIFEIFQRLQRSEDYPGTGIGLAMVKKSMERLGGKVWAESIPGKGSTFYLEIPKI